MVLSSEKQLTALVYKPGGYCFCVPKPELVRLALTALDRPTIQKILLQKNADDFSVVPMLMLIFVKNKVLRQNPKKSQCLSELIILLLDQLVLEDRNQIFHEMNRMAENPSFSAEQQTHTVELTQQFLGAATQEADLERPSSSTATPRPASVPTQNRVSLWATRMWKKSASSDNTAPTQGVDCNENTPLLGKTVSSIVLR